MLFWSGSFIAIKLSLDGFEPMMAATLRIFLAAVFLALYRLCKKVPFPRERGLVFKVAVIGLFSFAMPWALLFWGEQFVPPAIAAILNSTTPIFVLMFSWFFLPQDRPTWVGAFGVLLGFVGIVMVFWPEIRSENFVTSTVMIQGMLAVLGMAVCYGIGAVGIRKVCKGVDLPWVVTIQCLFSSVALFVFSQVFGFETGWREIHQVPIKPWIAILYLAICSTAMANVFFYRLIEQWGALKASAVTYAIPFVAILIDMVFLSTRPTFLQVLGAVFIVSGLAFIHVLRKKPLRGSHR